jgi:hypothetical protein
VAGWVKFQGGANIGGTVEAHDGVMFPDGITQTVAYTGGGDVSQVIKVSGGGTAPKTPTGIQAVAMGYNTTAGGDYGSTAMGNATTASGAGSTAMGFQTIAQGNQSTAMGNQTTATGESSTAMGANTRAFGQYSTAMGQNTTASGQKSTAMGSNTIASGVQSTAMGATITVTGNRSFGIGLDNTSRTITQAQTMAIVGGNVAIGTTEATGAELVVKGNNAGVPGLQIITTGTKPAASEAYRGAIFVEQGSSGVPDKVYMCLKMNADGSYQWVQIAIGQ